MLYTGLVYAVVQPVFECRAMLSKHKFHQMGLNQLLAEGVPQILELKADCQRKYAA